MISLVFPTFNEEENISALHERLTKIVATLKKDCEFIFVDDCSSDKTPDILKKLHKKDKRVKTIRFARNAGSHAAISAGLHYAKGDCVIVMAADLQDPPELISDLITQWSNGIQLVWGVRQERKGESFQTRFFSNLYYIIMNSFCAIKTPPSGADVFLADRIVLDAFKEIKETHTSVFMTLAWLGFKQSTIEYVKKARHAGRSNWTFQKKVKLTIDSLLSFSDVPIRLMSVIGFAVILTGFCYALILSLSGIVITPWTTVLIVILVLSGMQMMMFGVLGEYLWRTFDEARNRPKYIIEYTID